MDVREMYVQTTEIYMKKCTKILLNVKPLPDAEMLRRNLREKVFIYYLQ